MYKQLPLLLFFLFHIGVSLLLDRKIQNVIDEPFGCSDLVMVEIKIPLFIETNSFHWFWKSIKLEHASKKAVLGDFGLVFSLPAYGEEPQGEMARELSIEKSCFHSCSEPDIESKYCST